MRPRAPRRAAARHTISAPTLSRQSLRRAVLSVALLGALGPSAPASAADETYPFRKPSIIIHSSSAGLGSHFVTIGGVSSQYLDYTQAIWSLDGQPINQPPGAPQFWLDKPRDGKTHTLSVSMPRVDIPGATHTESKTFRAYKSLELAAAPQSASVARKRGIAVQVSAGRGYYRLRTTHARIPAAGGVSIESRSGAVRTVRLRGSYLDRIRPGMRLRVHARHLSRGAVLESRTITVRFT